MPKYEVKILELGSEVDSMLQNKMIILFNNKAPEELKPYCVITNHGKVSEPVAKGDSIIINNNSFTITSVGEEANNNLYSLGHVTLCFDGKDVPQLPGKIHLDNQPCGEISKDDKILIKKNNG